MGVSVIIGGQYGYEGKGIVTKYWSDVVGALACVRVGGLQEGHVVYDNNGKKYVLRQLPCTSVCGNIVSIIPSGAYIDLDILLSEISMLNIPSHLLSIDLGAVVISKGNKIRAKSNAKQMGISKLGGETDAMRQRVECANHLVFAKDVKELQPYLSYTKRFMRSLLKDNKNIVIEGSYGYGLSNLHTWCYPYAVSRDTTAASFLSETGLSPLDVDHVVMVLKTFPVGDIDITGPMAGEIEWGEVSKIVKSDSLIKEYSPISGKAFRVSRFNPSDVQAAIEVNNPDILFLNRVDYYDMSNQDSSKLSERQREYISWIQSSIRRKINYVCNGLNTIIPFNWNAHSLVK